MMGVNSCSLPHWSQSVNMFLERKACERKGREEEAVSMGLVEGVKQPAVARGIADNL